MHLSKRANQRFRPLRPSAFFRPIIITPYFYSFLRMVSTSLFDDGPEIEFPNEIMSSKFHPTIPNLFVAGSISGHLHWFENKNNSFF
jgi:hypothetical protein